MVFFASAERVHVAKDGARAERTAALRKAERAEADLVAAKAARKVTLARLTRYPHSERRKAAAELAEVRVARAEEALTVAQQGTRTDPMQAPEWLLPVSLDLIAFMAIWTGLSGPTPGPISGPPQTKKPTKGRKPKKTTTRRGGNAAVPVKRQRKPTPSQLRAKGRPDLTVV